MGNQPLSISGSGRSDDGATDGSLSSDIMTSLRRRVKAKNATMTSSQLTNDEPCPADLIGATPYPRSDERTVPRVVDLKVFPSFNGLENGDIDARVPGGEHGEAGESREEADDGGANRRPKIIYAQESVVYVKVYPRMCIPGREGEWGEMEWDDDGVGEDGQGGVHVRRHHKMITRSQSHQVVLNGQSSPANVTPSGSLARRPKKMKGSALRASPPLAFHRSASANAALNIRNVRETSQRVASSVRSSDVTVPPTGTIHRVETGTIPPGNKTSDSSERAALPAGRTASHSEPATVTPGSVTIRSEQRPVSGLVVFEREFVSGLLRHYRSLSLTARMSLLSVAIHQRRTGAHRHVTLQRYLVKRDVPAQLLEQDDINAGQYVPTIPDSLFHIVMHVRHALVADASRDAALASLQPAGQSSGGVSLSSQEDIVCLQAAVAEEIVRCIGEEAASELSRIYEYQISMISSPPESVINRNVDEVVRRKSAEGAKGEEEVGQWVSVRTLADHAVDCALAYTSRRRGVWDRNNLVRGAVLGHATELTSGDVTNDEMSDEIGVGAGVRTTRAQVIRVKRLGVQGGKEVEWQLHEILKKPGLRKDRLLFSDFVDSNRMTDDVTCWEYLTSPDSDPLLYGYRGQLLDWDYCGQTYSIVAEDDTWFNQKVPWFPETDLHQLYNPLRVLIGIQVMRNYCALATREKCSLRDYVQQRLRLLGRRHIPPRPITTTSVPAQHNPPTTSLQPVYRPLKAFSLNSFQLGRVNFDGADLTRIHLAGADLVGTSLRGTTLRHARLSLTRLGGVGSCRGADVSYSTAQDSLLPEGLLSVVASATFTLVGSCAPPPHGPSPEAAEGKDRESEGGGEGRKEECELCLSKPLVCVRGGNVVDFNQVIENIKKDFVEHKENVGRVARRSPATTGEAATATSGAVPKRKQLRKRSKKRSSITATSNDVHPTARMRVKEERNEDTSSVDLTGEAVGKQTKTDNLSTANAIKSLSGELHRYPITELSFYRSVAPSCSSASSPLTSHSRSQLDSRKTKITTERQKFLSQQAASATSAATAMAKAGTVTSPTGGADEKKVKRGGRDGGMTAAGIIGASTATVVDSGAGETSPRVKPGQSAVITLSAISKRKSPATTPTEVSPPVETASAIATKETMLVAELTVSTPQIAATTPPMVVSPTGTDIQEIVTTPNMEATVTMEASQTVRETKTPKVTQTLIKTMTTVSLAATVTDTPNAAIASLPNREGENASQAPIPRKRTTKIATASSATGPATTTTITKTIASTARNENIVSCTSSTSANVRTQAIASAAEAVIPKPRKKAKTLSARTPLEPEDIAPNDVAPITAAKAIKNSPRERGILAEIQPMFASIPVATSGSAEAVRPTAAVTSVSNVLPDIPKSVKTTVLLTASTSLDVDPVAKKRTKRKRVNPQLGENNQPQPIINISQSSDEFPIPGTHKIPDEDVKPLNIIVNMVTRNSSVNSKNKSLEKENASELPRESARLSVKALPPALCMDWLDSACRSAPVSPTRSVSPVPGEREPPAGEGFAGIKAGNTPIPLIKVEGPDKKLVGGSATAVGGLGAAGDLGGGLAVDMRGSLPDLTVTVDGENVCGGGGRGAGGSGPFITDGAVFIAPRLAKSRSLQTFDLTFDLMRDSQRDVISARELLASHVVVKNLHKSQIFKMISTELNISELGSNLPAPSNLFVGRSREVSDLVALLDGTAGGRGVAGGMSRPSRRRLITIIGTDGVGKSDLALAVCHNFCPAIAQPQHLSVGGRGGVNQVGAALDTDRQMRMTCIKPDERHYFYHWLNAHAGGATTPPTPRRPLLLLLDNIDLPHSEHSSFTEFVDELMLNVLHSRLLCTSRRPFYRGPVNTEALFRLGPLSEDATCALLRRLVPELEATGVSALATACHRIPFSVRLVAAAFKLGEEENVDTRRLFQQLTATSLVSADLPANIEIRLNRLVTGNNKKQDRQSKDPSIKNEHVKESQDVHHIKDEATVDAKDGHSNDRANIQPHADGIQPKEHSTADIQTKGEASENESESHKDFLTKEQASEKRQLMETVRCILTVLDALDVTCSRVLSVMSCFTNQFELTAMVALASASKEKKTAATKALETLTELGLVETSSSPRPEKYTLPRLVRLIGAALLSERGREDMGRGGGDEGGGEEEEGNGVMGVVEELTKKEYASLTLNKLVSASGRFHSRQSLAAVLSTHVIYDDIIDILTNIIKHQQVYTSNELVQLVTLEGATFLHEVLPHSLYAALFEQIETEADERGDVVMQCRALACLSYHHAARADSLGALETAERADRLARCQQDALDESEMAFVMFSLGKAIWMNDNEDIRQRKKGLNLVKQSFETFKLSTRLSDVRTLYAGELYGSMLTREENYQTARHWYNVFDAATRDNLDRHPMTIDGLNSRRAIWDRLSLFDRATAAARKASRHFIRALLEIVVSQKSCELSCRIPSAIQAVLAARSYYGDHPLTAAMFVLLADTASKKGSQNEAIGATVGALAIRVKVLGDHLLTSASYGALARLMLKCGQFERATIFCNNAIDVLDRLSKKSGSERNEKERKPKKDSAEKGGRDEEIALDKGKTGDTVGDGEETKSEQEPCGEIKREEAYGETKASEESSREESVANVSIGDVGSGVERGFDEITDPEELRDELSRLLDQALLRSSAPVPTSPSQSTTHSDPDRAKSFPSAPGSVDDHVTIVVEEVTDTNQVVFSSLAAAPANNVGSSVESGPLTETLYYAVPETTLTKL